MKRIGILSALWSGGFALVLAATPQAQAAATANFQGLCTWNASYTQYTCNFDANRPASSPSSCPGSFVWKYSWDFDDGSTLLTGNPQVSHLFPNGDDRFVGLKVICWNGEAPVKGRHVCVHFGTPGCLQVNGTWN